MGSGALFFDYDDDGWLDVFIVDGMSRHRLFRNRGNGTFEDLTAQSGITRGAYGMGACAADYDNDGARRRRSTESRSAGPTGTVRR